MSIESMAVVLHHSTSRSTTKLVLLGIANHDGDGGAWPSVATLAKYANCTPRNVQAALRFLEQAGEIQTFTQGGGTLDQSNATRPNRYVILLRCPEGCSGGPKHVIHRGEAHFTRGVKPTSPGGRSPLHPGGEAHFTQTINEPSENRPSTAAGSLVPAPANLRALIKAAKEGTK